MLSINTNLSSLIAQNSMKTSTNKLNQAIERMSTGFKINHSKDNAANYSISTNMSTKIGSLQVAEDNASMGLDLITTATGNLELIQDKLTRLRDLAEQSSNGTYGEQSLKAINSEANALVDEINRIYSTAEYNGLKLFGTSETQQAEPAQASEPIATFGMARATTENKFIADPISYSKEKVEDMVTMTEFINGTVSDTNTYSISTKEELVALADYVNANKDTTGMTFVLGADIDLSSISNWTPIGKRIGNSFGYIFNGVFDGNGYEIIGLNIGNIDQAGLFSNLGSSSIVKNLGLSNVTVNVTSGYSAVGTIASRSEGNIINCYAKGNINAWQEVGGLVGTNSGTITSCYMSGVVNGTGGQVGGITGYAKSGSNISNCYAEVELEGSSYVGGIIGYALSNTIISNCYSTGTVKAGERVGGIAGASSANIVNCYSTSNVEGTRFIGGLIGLINGGSISNSYATGSVKGISDLGELGYFSSGTITNSYATGSVSGTSGSKSIKNSDDWDGTCFTYDYGVANFLGNGGTVDPDDPDTPGGIGGGGIGGTGGSVAGTPVGAYAPGSIVLQIGSDNSWSSQIGVDLSFTLDEIDTLRGIGLDKTTDYFTMIDDMLEAISAKQVQYGASQNRLESALDEISTKYENLVSSRSTLRDADIAKVSSTYIQQQILQQASATLLSTANQTPSIALQLI